MGLDGPTIVDIDSDETGNSRPRAAYAREVTVARVKIAVMYNVLNSYAQIG